MKVAKTILVIFGLFFAGYALFSEEPTKVMPFVLLLLGGFMILKSIDELNKARGPYKGLFQIMVGVVALFASYQAFVM